MRPREITERFTEITKRLGEITERPREIAEGSLRVPRATKEVAEHFLGDREPLGIYMRGF